ncbi:MAG: PPC domain-containing protein [Hydrogenophilaceae bacterium]|jgi:hypothetical protein|nr:PPC domain-containing protein [Hydrogenophilaceae bacterium]
MKNFWLAGAAMLAGFTGLVGTAAARDRTEGADVSAETSTTGRINPGDTMAGAIEPADDQDWYRIRLQAERTYRFTLVGGEEEGRLGDPYLELRDASGGEPVAQNDDSDESLNSSLDYTPSATGYFYIGARGYSADDSGAYTLTVTQLPPPPPPQPLGMDSTVTGSIDANGEKDRFRVTLQAGTPYRIALRSEGEGGLSDPYVAVYAPGDLQNAAAEDDDGGGGLNSYLQFTPSVTGAHIIVASAFGDFGTGAYALSIREGDIPGSAETDVAIDPAGDSRTDTIAPAGDVDWFRMTMSAGQIARVTLAGADAQNASALGDPLLQFVDGAGEVLAQDDDGGPGLNSYLEVEAPADGVYYLVARAFADGGEGGYSLEVQPGEIPGDAQSNEMLEPYEPRSSRINAAGDADWFAISMVEGRSYRITAESGGGEGELGDPLLTLIAPDGNPMATDDDGGPGLGAYISVIAPATGTYYAQVTGFADSVGAYAVSVIDNEVPGDASTDAWLDGAGDERAGGVGFPNDKDAYRLNVEAGASYRVTVSPAAEGGLATPSVSIRDFSSEEPVTQATARGGRRGAQAVATFTAAEDSPGYFAVVSGPPGATGDYIIAIERTGAAPVESPAE